MCEVVAVVVSLGGGFLFSLVTRGFQCLGLNVLTLPDAVPLLPTLHQAVTPTTGLCLFWKELSESSFQKEA